MNPVIAIPVRQFRRADAAVRKMRRNDGRTNATIRALAAYRRDQERAIADLVQAGQHEIVGLLTAEAQLAERLRQARAAGQARPELSYRLRCTRRDITKLAYAA